MKPFGFDLRARLEAILASGSAEGRRPVLRKGNESNVRGLYIIGDLAGAPVIKLAMAQGVEVIDFISSFALRSNRDGFIRRPSSSPPRHWA